MRIFPTLLLLISGIWFHPALLADHHAKSASNCPQISDRAARLDCFDREFPTPELIPAPAEFESIMIPQTQQVTDSTALQAAEVPSTVAKSDPSTAPAKESTRSSFGKRLGNLFRAGEKESISASIKAVRRGSQQKMVFLLDNDQVWLQSSPRSLPLAAGDEVTIKQGSIGGFIMRNKNGVSTRVSRIK